MSTKDTMLTWARRIREHSGMEYRSIIQAGVHGADAGWPGFTYYTDCVKFYEAHSREIDALIAEDAESHGFDSPMSFMASWGCANTMQDYDTIANGKAWYVLEVTGHLLSDAQHDPGCFA